MYSAYNPRPRLSSSSNTSIETISEAQSDSDAEFTLLEGSSLASDSFAWSSSEISIGRERRESTRNNASPSAAIVARRPLPLMAFFAYLLAAEDATLRLIEHPHPTDSPLFPGPPLAHPASEVQSPDTQHGLFRLLGHRPRALRDGDDSAFVPPNAFASSPFHILCSWVEALLSR